MRRRKWQRNSVKSYKYKWWEKSAVEGGWLRKYSRRNETLRRNTSIQWNMTLHVWLIFVLKSLGGSAACQRRKENRRRRLKVKADPEASSIREERVWLYQRVISDRQYLKKILGQSEAWLKWYREEDDRGWNSRKILYILLKNLKTENPDRNLKKAAVSVAGRK